MNYQERKQAHLQRRRDHAGLDHVGQVELADVYIPTFLRFELEGLAGARPNGVAHRGSPKLLGAYLTKVLEAHVESLEDGP